jgi:CubicO group peptidase (beta-lactamase class C family)
MMSERRSALERTALCAGLIILFACYAVVGASPNDEPIGAVQDVYNGTLRPDVQVNTFRHIDRLFPSRTVSHGSSVYPLPLSDKPLMNVHFVSKGKNYDVFDYLSLNRVSGLLIIKDGKVAFEDYELGNTAKSRWVSWSMVKSISSTLVGAAIKDGSIASIDDPITKYLPQLSGGAYDGVAIRNVLQMASGAKWDETYTDPRSDRRHMLNLQIEQKPGAILKFMATLPRAAAPGSRWNYSTGETHVVGALISAAVKHPVAQYLSEKIWSKFGMETDATWWLESPGGLEVGGSGFSATLRDYGRFGLFVLNSGKTQSEDVVPAGWFAEAGSSKQVGGKPVDYGYMWWTYGPTAKPPNQGAFQAEGIFGQFLYIHPRERVVVAVWSARPKPTGADTIDDADFFAGVVAALRPSDSSTQAHRAAQIEKATGRAARP